jgi:acyl-CoA synthetase (AMP-forming)/AMP-acid ligase II
MHIGGIWLELARRYADRPAIIDDQGTWTYRQFQSRIARFGNALRGLGLRKGDRVALLIPDVREYLEADYGAMSAGFVRVPLDPRLTRQDLEALLRHAGAAALVTHASFAEKVEGLTGEVESLGHIIMIGAFSGKVDTGFPQKMRPTTAAGGAGLDCEVLLERASEQAHPDGDGEDLAALNFSGGTTGAPKAVMLRHRNLATVARNTIHGFAVGSDSVFLSVRPLWPIAQVILMSHLFAGATVVLSRFDPEMFATLVEQSGATRTSLVPTQLVRCLDHLQAGDERIARLQAIYVGGSRIPPDVFERALEIVGPKIGALYGLTEAPVTCYLPPATLAAGAEARSRLIQSVGSVLPDYEARIAGSDRSGEVLIRGDNVMAGYWQDEAATCAALRDGWLHTGDIGEFDAAGNLSIVGRLKEVIRSGSSTVIPKEVEDVMARHPAVAEVAVLGLPDAEWGEAVTAFVVVKPGMSVTELDLVEHCRARLASYKKPRAIRFVASLPRSHYGKVLRAQLIAQAMG